MIFSSNIFLFVFLPVFLALYYMTPNRYRSWIILLGSYSFYAWWRIDFLLLFFAVTVWNYLIGLRIESTLDKPVVSKRWLILGVVLNLSTLGYFKYVNFGVVTVNAVFSELGLDPWLVTQVILPIGISFYIFQAISYIIDVHRRDTPATHNPIDFAAFIALFPQLIAGPVLRYKDVAHQFKDRTHTLDKFSEGVQRFMLGFVKKVIIADSIAPLVDNGFALENPSMADAWLSTLAYTAQLYFDFSGYADMAIGLGLMMGFRFMENFKHPYISQSITEFWRRWHISLSSWLRDYLYVPLGGNRKGKVKTYRNLLLTMILGGFWHGANWTFLVWGIWHGSLLAIEKALRLKVSAEHVANSFVAIRWLLTLVLVMLGWVVFRADTLTTAFAIYSAMIDFSNVNLTAEYLNDIRRSQLVILAAAWGLIVYRGFYQRRLENGAPAIRYPLAYAAVLLPLFLLALLKLSAQSYSAFLYFQF